MTTEALLVLDVGKTHAKMTLLDAGHVLATRVRANLTSEPGGCKFLDAAGIETWLVATLAELAKLAPIEAIVPVGHGAAAALVCDDDLARPVLDYETQLPDHIARRYARERGDFSETLSPALPQGLNLGAQLFWQEHLYPDIWPRPARAMLWPQYWAWRLCGEHAAEVTSLGCHTDLWLPLSQDWSPLARRHGWDAALGPVRPAATVLGHLRGEIAQAAQLPGSCEVLCGLHDSNAALHAARGLAELGQHPFVLLSTGTWFVAMQSGAETPHLDPKRDTLANVDVEGRPVPSSRFMGGREYELMLGDRIGAAPTRDDALRLIARGVASVPSFVAGSGPFPRSQGAVHGEPDGPAEQAALASLHLALMADASLDLIAAQGPIIVEGRFAKDAVFPAALAALRRGQPVYRTVLAHGVALGAARLKHPHLRGGDALVAIAPLETDLECRKRDWRAHAA